MPTPKRGMSGVSGDRNSAAAAREDEEDEEEDESDEEGDAHGSPERAEATLEVADEALAAATDLYLCALTADACDMATRFAECAPAVEAAAAPSWASVAESAPPFAAASFAAS